MDNEKLPRELVVYCNRLQMDANGESTGRRWQKGIHVQGPIIVAQ